MAPVDRRRISPASLRFCYVHLLQGKSRPVYSKENGRCEKGSDVLGQHVDGDADELALSNGGKCQGHCGIEVSS
ncbi:Aquaporin9like [Caligus rogercresseyi]|uniref:Aquaporin9like n=1 Tax=Caligus rogercresseyi TaxID=217165 RepID=A0A7T8GSY2_CALRO|nr:Aquaporin9like [Caligus rogercresseyi]